MADRFATQTGAGTQDGLTPENAWAVASIPWGSMAGHELYLLDTITSAITISNNGTLGNEITVRGDYSEREATITTGTGSGITTNGNYLIIKNLLIDGCALHGIVLGNAGSYNNQTIDNVTSINNTGIGIRHLQAAASRILSDIVVKNCTVNDNGAEGIRITIEVGGAATSYLQRITIKNTEVLRNTTLNMNLGDSGHNSDLNEDLIVENCNISDAVGINGGTQIKGWISSTTAQGKNIFRNNFCDRNYGVAGGLNLLRSSYFEINNNQCNDNYAYQNSTKVTATIDGCGILLDDNCDNILCYNNECSGNEGNTTYNNSGAGIMILSVTNSKIYNNIGTGNRSGIEFGGASAHTGSQIYNNTYLDCIEFGLQIANAVTDNVTEFKNNIFTGNNVETNTGIYRNTGTDQTDEDYNLVYNFDNVTTNHTLGSNGLTVDPLLNSDYSPSASSPCIGAGIATLDEKDFNGEYNKSLSYDIGAIWFNPIKDSTQVKQLASGGTE